MIMATKKSPEDLQRALEESEVPEDKLPSRFTGFFYGEFGTWKTVTAVKIAKALGTTARIIAADDGWVSLHNHPELAGMWKIYEYQGMSQLTAMAESATEDETIILDTVSQMQEEYVDFLMDNVTWGGSHRTVAKARDPRTKLEEEIEVPGMVDYHFTRNKMRVPIKKLIKCPAHVIFLAHVREPSVMQPNETARKPSLTEKVFLLTAREAHVLGFMERDRRSNEVKVHFKSDTRTVARSRIGSLSDKDISANDLPNYISEWKENLSHA